MSYVQPSIKNFDSRTEAEAEQSTMLGWDTEVVENPPLDFLPVSEENKTTFSIRCDGSKFLYEDGYVR